MNKKDHFSSFYQRILSGPLDSTGTFVYTECTYGDLYHLAAAIRSYLSSLKGRDDAICLYTENKTLIAAAISESGIKKDRT